MNYYLSSYLLSKINLLFFFIKPELPWCCNDEDEKFVYICYLCSLLCFFFTVKVRVYLVKSGIAYKVSTVR